LALFGSSYSLKAAQMQARLKIQEYNQIIEEIEDEAIKAGGFENLSPARQK